MGTSNWQNIPFCVEVLMKIEPKAVLDVGVGFGRWGMVVREFCEAWFGRLYRRDWAIRIEGIEAFPDNIDQHHRDFYDKIHLGDATEALPSLLASDWDLVVFGDVIEHLPKEVGVKLLTAAIEKAGYVLVNVPLGSGWSQRDGCHNPYERYQSVWTSEDFQLPSLRRHAFFTDYVGRLFGSFVLSRLDRRGLSESLFSKGHAGAGGWRDHRESPKAGKEQELSRRVAVLEQELRRIQASLVWRMREMVVHSRVGPPLARSLIFARKSVSWLVRNQQGFWKGKIQWFRRTSASSLPSPLGENTSSNRTGSASRSPRSATVQYTERESKWLAETCARKPRVIAVCNPHWMGVTSSTKTLFDDVLLVEDTADNTEQVRCANLLAETGCARIVFSGLAPACLQIIRRLHKMSPGTKIAILWHGNFLHCAENLDWAMFRAACEFCRDGVVWKIGFVKKGMADVTARAGINGAFVMNYVERVPEQASTPMEGGPHIAVWSYPFMWRKYPYAMMASILMIPQAKLHAHMVNARVRDFLDVFRVPLSRATNSWIPHDKMLDHLSQMHLNLYVTLSECAPMLPLESLSVGVPCLFGPTSHHFEDNEYLHNALVVSSPDSARAIGLQAIRALEQRQEIVSAYKEYAPEYNKRARKSVEDFIED